MAKVDLRKVLRAIAAEVQDENLDRLLTGTTVRGGTVFPRAVEAARSVGRSKRVRLFGIRVSVRELADKVGVKSGEMLKDATRRSNAKITRIGFKIVPSPAMRTRWFAFMAGTKRQPPRPVSGISDSTISKATATIAFESRNQFVKGARPSRDGTLGGEDF